ncbi:hypothetical protein TWF281_002166 [Arthrobotrys megalospora]
MKISLSDELPPIIFADGGVGTQENMRMLEFKLRDESVLTEEERISLDQTVYKKLPASKQVREVEEYSPSSWNIRGLETFFALLDREVLYAECQEAEPNNGDDSPEQLNGGHHIPSAPNSEADTATPREASQDISGQTNGNGTKDSSQVVERRRLRRKATQNVDNAISKLKTSSNRPKSGNVPQQLRMNNAGGPPIAESNHDFEETASDSIAAPTQPPWVNEMNSWVDKIREQSQRDAQEQAKQEINRLKRQAEEKEFKIEALLKRIKDHERRQDSELQEKVMMDIRSAQDKAIFTRTVECMKNERLRLKLKIVSPELLERKEEMQRLLEERDSGNDS